MTRILLTKAAARVAHNNLRHRGSIRAQLDAEQLDIDLDEVHEWSEVAFVRVVEGVIPEHLRWRFTGALAAAILLGVELERDRQAKEAP